MAEVQILTDIGGQCKFRRAASKRIPALSKSSTQDSGINELGPKSDLPYRSSYLRIRV